MDRRNNPAGRLFEVLEAAFSEADDNKLIIDVWRSALRTNDDARLFGLLGSVYSLPDQIKYQVHQLSDVNHEMLLRGLPAIEDALRQPLHHQWVHFGPRVPDVARFQLENAADALARGSVEPVVPEDDLAAIHNEVKALFNEIAQADIDEQLKIVLARYVHAMDAAIMEVRIRGVVALQDVIEMTWGGEFLRDQKHEPPTSEEGKRLRTKVLGLAVALGSFVSLANGVVQLGGNVYKALPIGEEKTAAQEEDETLDDAQVVEVVATDSD